MNHKQLILAQLCVMIFCFFTLAQEAKWDGGTKRTSFKIQTEEKQSRYYSFSVWVKCNGKDLKYPCIAGNKSWEGLKVISLLSSRNMGETLESGKSNGWVFAIQPNGAWTWNAGDGKRRLDYLPTAKRQNVCDGKWHLLAFSADKEQRLIRLYFDGINVATYSMNYFGKNVFNGDTFVGGDRIGKLNSCDVSGQIEGAKFSYQKLSDEEVFSKYKTKFPEAKAQDLSQPVGQLRMLSWNIWHGARHPGIEKGVNQATDFIKSTKADIITMQETYGSGPTIADRLGYYYYERSDNLSIMSRFPIREIHQLYRPLWFGGATIQLSKNQHINVFCLWIHYLPAWRRDAAKEGATAESLIKGEWKTRASEMKDILKLLQPFIKESTKTPLVVGGDFNSPSLLDWSKKTSHWHNDLEVKWPVSEQMIAQGFKDAFREIHKDPIKFKRHDQWKGGPERLTFRIDYLYSHGPILKVVDANMFNTHNGGWASDHPAVLATYQFNKEQSKSETSRNDSHGSLF